MAPGAYRAERLLLLLLMFAGTPTIQDIVLARAQSRADCVCERGRALSDRLSQAGKELGAAGKAPLPPLRECVVVAWAMFTQQRRPSKRRDVLRAEMSECWLGQDIPVLRDAIKVGR